MFPTDPEVVPDASLNAYRIRGHRPLQGSIRAQAAKNAVTKQLVASLLTREPCRLHDVPDITEIDVVLDMLAEVGTAYDRREDGAVDMATPEITSTSVGERYSGVNRIPVLLIAPLLHRAGIARVPVVGGCNIGERPIDFHIDLLRKMGAEIDEDDEGYTARADRLRGTVLALPYPSVGATENAIFAACLAEGTTVIDNAAVEPEIVDTVLFLQKMGALIQIDTDRKIVIEGVEQLSGASHDPVRDRIEVASFAMAAVATRGRIRIEGADQAAMITFLNTLRKIGGGFEVDAEAITFFRARDRLDPIHIETDVHPGFMTDWQQPMVTLLTQAEGVSVVHETVYEKRFGYTSTLNEMGANITLTKDCLGGKECRFTDRNFPHSAIVQGPTPLAGRQIGIPDLRAGFAYLLAALIADGESTIFGTRFIERGYVNVPGRLASVGADIDVPSQQAAVA
ncbi:MAG: UDP-N-acetylglucosamine 1-carboxyvinyltransferase [Gammaproteobacteria bacterium]|nr:UDP-N-acetylglucosamine 1-carboxyvinyltransferase [Gammaproteobacteria bacterium]